MSIPIELSNVNDAKNIAKIKLSKKDLDECRQFSDMIDASFYENRNQFDDNKRKIDIVIGKAGELIAYYYLKKTYPEITYPDFMIYSTNKKSWDYDLKTSSINLHVKSQSFLQENNFSSSWIFQNEDKHIFKKYKDNDFVIFVSINLMESHGIIKKILPVKLLHEKELFKKPILANLISKSAIYYDDIKDIESYL